MLEILKNMQKIEIKFLIFVCLRFLKEIFQGYFVDFYDWLFLLIQYIFSETSKKYNLKKILKYENIQKS